VAAEVTRDRNQKTESAEKEGGKQFWVYEINEDFRLMARPGLPAALTCVPSEWHFARALDGRQRRDTPAAPAGMGRPTNSPRSNDFRYLAKGCLSGKPLAGWSEIEMP